MDKIIAQLEKTLSNLTGSDPDSVIARAHLQDAIQRLKNRLAIENQKSEIKNS